MQVRPFVDGDYGSKHFEAGETLDFDCEYVRRLLVNGLAEPLDDHARDFLAKTEQHEPYRSQALQRLAEQIQADEN